MSDGQSSTTNIRLGNLAIRPQSQATAGDIQVGATDTAQGSRLVVLASAASLAPFQGEASEYDGKSLLVGEPNAHNIAQLRTLFPWLRPEPLSLRTSAGMGDRLGLATPGHVRAVRAVGGKVRPIFPQQSIREMVRTNRSPQQVMDDATWGVFYEGWRDGFGADADHLKTPADIDRCVAAGYTFFTIDPGEFVNNAAEDLPASELQTAFDALPWAALEDDAASLRNRYLGSTIDLEGHKLSFDEQSLTQAAVKYGRVVAQVVMMYRHLLSAINGRPFELEISVDETELPTKHVEHVYIVRELWRLGVRWVSLAPRYIGRFEKGVDYIGDLGAFEADFALHAAIARLYGPYKLSLHSGSDKFSVYSIATFQTHGLVHLKTAGTSYLEALRAVATLDPAFFREIYAFCRANYEKDRATYHVSAKLDHTPTPESVPERDLSALIDQFDAREVLHVTFGSVLTAKAANGPSQFYDHIMNLLRANPEVYASNLEAHFIRHLAPFAVAQVSPRQ